MSPWDSEFESIIRQTLRHLPPGAALKPDSSLFDLGLDSLGTIHLVVRLEDAYSIDVPDEEIRPEAFATSASLWGMVQRVRGVGRVQ